MQPRSAAPTAVATNGSPLRIGYISRVQRNLVPARPRPNGRPHFDRREGGPLPWLVRHPYHVPVLEEEIGAVGNVAPEAVAGKRLAAAAPGVAARLDHVAHDGRAAIGPGELLLPRPPLAGRAVVDVTLQQVAV